VLAVCSFGLALSSALWLAAAPGRLWPIAVDAVVSGALLGGHGLAVFATPLAIAPPRGGRPLHLAAFVAVGGLSFGLASVAGGAITGAAPALTIGAGVLFAASSCGRLGAGLLALRILEPGARSVADLTRLCAQSTPLLRARSSAG
jgi:hypothetical protein